MKRLRISLLAATIAVVLVAGPASALGDNAVRGRVPASAVSTASSAVGGGAAVPGRFLVKARPSGKTALAALDALPGVSATDVRPGPDRTATVRTPKGKSDAQFLRELKASPEIEYAEPNYIRNLAAYAVPPNDPWYASSGGFFFPGTVAPVSWARSWWQRDSNANTGMNIASLWSSLEAPTFPARATGSAIKVAVIDSGFYSAHPDAGTNILVGKDEFDTYTSSTGVLTTDGDVTPVDPAAPNNSVTSASHGTCVAGEISAGTNNGVGVAGVSYDSTVLVYKVMGVWTDGNPANGYPAGSAVIFDEAVIRAIYDATDAGVKVINMSLAGPEYSAALQSAINYAWSHGVLVVAATGNTGTLNGVQYPGANNHVVGVGSYVVNGPSDASPPTYKMRSTFTDYGNGGDPAAGANNGRLDILAPGEGIWGLIQPGYDHDGAGTVYEPGYFWWQGTSMASPAFAGMAAMVWRFAPALTADEIANVFFATGVNAGSNLGYGYVNPTAAYSKLKTDYAYLLAPAALSLPPATNNSVVPLSWSAVAGRSVSYDVFDNGTFQKNVTGTSTTLTLGEGSHIVSVTPRSAYNWWNPATNKSATVVVDFAAVPVTLTGTVTFNASPLAGVSVSVPGTTTVTTAASGTYTVGGIFPGTHTVTYSKPGFATQTLMVPVTTDPETVAPSVAMVALTPIYRFFNKLNASHFYTASETEKNSVIANLSAIYALDGVAYKVSSAYTTPLHRFYNRLNGSHFYTASDAEKNDVLANLSAIYSYDGVAYKVSRTSVTGSTPVYRFFNKQNASHFYTASEAEKNGVIANLSATYVLDGIAFYVVP